MTNIAPWFSLPTPPALTPTSPSVLIIGAGLGGCWLARTLAESGIHCTIIESNDVATGASGNRSGIVKPYVSRKSDFTAYFYAQALDYLLQRLQDWQLQDRCKFIQSGVLQLIQGSYPESKYYSCLTEPEVSNRTGHELGSHGLWFEKGGHLDPFLLCHALLDHPLVEIVSNTTVNGIQTSNEYATVAIANGAPLDVDMVVLAAGSSLTDFAATANLPVTPARGQTSDFQVDASSTVPTCVISGKHYVIPGKDQVTVGATFIRGDTSTTLRDEEHTSNQMGLSSLLPHLTFKPTPMGGNAGVRATTPDRLPLVGPVPDHSAIAVAYQELHHGRPHEQYQKLPTVPRLMVLGGFGSRGIVTAAYCAELLSDYLLGLKNSGDTLESFASLLNPARFQIRELKRAR